jgi:DNA-binding transcriptional LysR family regulator
MDMAGLEAFVRIAECGSFRQAAATMNLSPTALTHRIKRLEQDLGTVLFQRTTRTLTLSQAGQDFFPKAREALLQLDQLYEGVKREGRQARERVVVGCLGSLGEQFLPPALREFSALYPGVHVLIYDETATALRERVAAGEVQFALTILGAQLWTHTSRVLFEEEFVAAVPTGHALAGREALTWADLAGHALARVSVTTSHGYILSESLSRLGHALDWRYEVQHVAMAVRLVVAGLAITVLPRVAIPAVPELRIVALAEPTIRRTVGMIWQNGAQLSKPALALQRLVLRAVARHQAAAADGGQIV